MSHVPYIPKYIYVAGSLSGDGKYLRAQDRIRLGYKLDKRLYNTFSVLYGNIPEKHDDFYSKLIYSIREGFSCREDLAFRAAKTIARRMRRKRNKYGIGLVGPVKEFVDGDEGKISYSPKNVSKKSKRRVKVLLSRFLKRNVLSSIRDSDLERIQIAFTGLIFSVMDGEDAAKLYEGTGKFKSSVTSNQSCMQGTTYNTHLFESNEGKYMLLVAAENDKIIGRTKLYKNDDGTYFLGTRTYSTKNIREDFEKYFEANFKYGPLNCTLRHEQGEEMPYIDETVDGYGMDRIDSSTIRLHKHGEFECNNTDGSEPDCKICCECDCSMEYEINGEYYCSECANECFVLIDDEWYSPNETVYSEYHDTNLVLDDAFSFIRNERGGEDWVNSIRLLFEYNDQWYLREHGVLVDGELVPSWLCYEDEDGNWRVSE